MRRWVGVAAVGWCAANAWAGQPTKVVLRLRGSGPVSRIEAKFQCDATALGQPSGVFKVIYVKSGETSLAVVPLKGEDQVFAQVLAASGSRYVAGRYTWWDARETMLIWDEGGSDEKRVACRSVK